MGDCIYVCGLEWQTFLNRTFSNILMGFFNFNLYFPCILKLFLSKSVMSTLVRMAERATQQESLTHACVARGGQATVARTTVRKESDILEIKTEIA